MSESPKYEISSVADFLKVPENRIEECLKDFAKFVELARATQGLLDAVTEQVVLDNNLDLRDGDLTWECNKFTWIDDGENKATITIGFREDSQ
jgi:hypothetical protein